MATVLGLVLAMAGAPVLAAVTAEVLELGLVAPRMKIL